MKQVLQSLRTGAIDLVHVPASKPGPGSVLIRTRKTLISAGTERMLIDFGRANWFAKVRQQPDKVRGVLDKVRVDGLSATIESVQAKLDQPLTLGYSNAGVVLEAGRDVKAFGPGDRVVSNGNHAEVVRVGQNLCARIPDSVSDEQACFAVVGAIALQGVRLANPTLGETFAVTGLGVIGLLAVQILRANGCRVLGIDLDPQKLDIARSFGAETINIAIGQDPVRMADFLTGGSGLDGVLITAATKSSEPVHQAAQMCRKRGRIVLVGVAGLELSRDDFYKKELTFQVSCSYGPGRYDPAYEREGKDYPLAYVRWTEQRNMEAVLQLMAEGRIDVQPLVSHRYSIEAAQSAYEVLQGRERYMGIVLDYPSDAALSEDKLREDVVDLAPAVKTASVRVAMIGAGQFASKVLIPALGRVGFHLDVIASTGGVTATHYGKKFGFARATTDLDAIFSDNSIAAVVIATQHGTHAELVRRGLEAGKHVYVEKPLCLTTEELNDLERVYRSLSRPPVLMVGFNRRFAPHAVKAKQLLSLLAHEPKSFVYTVNAGFIPADHWTQTASGGGRIIGEACHFIDLIRFLAGAPIESVHTSKTGEARDTATITLRFKDGSTGTIHYFSNGHKRFPKERLEVFCAGRILQLDNFRRLTAYGWREFHSQRLWTQDKGNRAAVAAFANAIRNSGVSPTPFEELIEVTRTSFAASET